MWNRALKSVNSLMESVEKSLLKVRDVNITILNFAKSFAVKDHRENKVAKEVAIVISTTLFYADTLWRRGSAQMSSVHTLTYVEQLENYLLNNPQNNLHTQLPHCSKNSPAIKLKKLVKRMQILF